MLRKFVFFLVLASLALAAFEPLAFAAPGGVSSITHFGDSVKDFLIYDLGRVIFVLGLCMAAFAMFFGRQDGYARAVTAIIAGALLYAAPHIVDFVRSSF
jgi:type IV secretory pathway VirB2 component (pilin)